MDVKTLTSILVCNNCHSDRLDYSDPAKITCERCSNTYLVVEDIVYTEQVLILEREGGEKTSSQELVSESARGYSNWWLKVNQGIGYRQNIERMFSAHTNDGLDSLENKLILDAGCGGGRHLSYVHQARNSTIVAFELGLGVQLAKEQNSHATNIIYIQGNILNLPFREGVFDYVYSFGVLHHTPDSRAAFFCLSRTVKLRGIFAVYLYHEKHKRVQNQSVLNAAHLIYRRIYRIPLRRLISKCPHWLVYGMCHVMYYFAVLEARLNRFSVIKPIVLILKALLPPHEYRPLETKKHNIVRNYDTLCTRYIRSHYFEEVLQWFMACGFSNVEHTRFGLSMKAVKESTDALDHVCVAKYEESDDQFSGDVEADGLRRTPRI